LDGQDSVFRLPLERFLLKVSKCKLNEEVDVVLEPDAPSRILLLNSSTSSLLLQWQPPSGNGAPIDYYLLQEEVTTSANFSTAYQGPHNQFNMEHLLPDSSLLNFNNEFLIPSNTGYTIRVSAHNKIGLSPWSDSFEFHTDAENATGIS
jgi:hypothetical protein